jgi:hypothetical protein
MLSEPSLNDVVSPASRQSDILCSNLIIGELMYRVFRYVINIG